MYREPVSSKCDKCSKQLIYEHKYTCCNRPQNLCALCSIGRCQKCQNQRSKYLESFSHHSNLDSYTSKYLKKCARCSQTQFSMHQILEDTKCNISYCYQCTLAVYQEYLSVVDKLKDKEGISPQIPFQMPCSCAFTQKEITLYLRKSCFACSRKINDYEQSYQMSNNTKIMKKCYEEAKRKVQSRFATNMDFQTFQQIENLIARCSGCADLMQEIGNKMDDIFVCKTCFRQMAATEKFFEQEKQMQIKSSKINQKKSPSKKKQCSACSRLFIPQKEDPPFVCKYCIEKQDKVKKEIKQTQLKKEESNKLVEANSKKNLKSQENQKDNYDEVQKISNFQAKTEETTNKQVKQMKQSKLQISLEIEKNKVEEKVTRQSEKQQLQRQQEQRQNIDNYELKISNELDRQIQCSQCLILFKEQALFKTYKKLQKDQSSVRVVQNDLQISRMSQEPSLIYYCHLCYFQIKFQINWQKNMVKKQKQRELLNSERISRSLPKRQKAPLDDYKSSLLKGYNYNTPTKVKEPQKMAFTTSKKYYEQPRQDVTSLINTKLSKTTTSKTAKRLCKECLKPIQKPYYSTYSCSYGDICDECRLKNIRNVNIKPTAQNPLGQKKLCKLCRTPKYVMSTVDYCSSCWMTIKRRP